LYLTVTVTHLNGSWRLGFRAEVSPERTLSSDYSRHIAVGEFTPKNSKSPQEIWQREKFGQLILIKVIEIVATRC